MRVPIATYRIQFNKGFGFRDALRIIGYLQELGITDVYSSPLMKARAGSLHGYDITDPTQLNPEIGTEAEFESMTAQLSDRGMGLLMDIVPNHMAASADNPWWFDVLENGQASPYAGFFDVDWEKKKVLLPILGKPYGEVLENNELQLRFEDGRPVVQYYEQVLPVAAGSDLRNREAIDRVLSQQHYRLAYWRKAEDSINYRRFFDISDLVALNAHKQEVFKATHVLPLKLIAEGKVTGLRIDHIDGLRDPQAYLEQLPAVYVAVEKILAGNERLRQDWRAEGTTGYDFLNILNRLFIDREGFETLSRSYGELTGNADSYADTFRKRKRQVITQLFSVETSALANVLSQLAEEDRHARDIPSRELKEAFIEVTACLPVYRTYIRTFQISEEDRARIEDALSLAGGLEPSVAFEFLRRVLLLEPAWYLQKSRPEYLDFVIRWQQFTGPVMAKGLEDTAFYVQNALISANEVGAEPNGPSAHLGIEEFHWQNQIRRDQWPRTMNATSTHDTKRSEDVRARINVLSEIPEEWMRHFKRWTRMHPRESAPDLNEQFMIYQTMLGAWPISAERLKQFVTKALREAKTHSSWIDINAEYESEVMDFIDQLLASAAFLRAFGRFQKKIAYFGAMSSLSMLLLKIASPGIPDFYQGNELWDLSLADPDNRRQVDFDARIAHMNRFKRKADPVSLLKRWENSRIKMYLMWKALNFRLKHESLFLEGEYIPLKAAAEHSEHIVAFARRHDDDWVVAAVPRFWAKCREACWNEMTIYFPQAAPAEWTNILTGEKPDPAAFPFMLLAPTASL